MSAPFLPFSQFAEACAVLPLVSIDLVLTTPDGYLLLGKRNNAPARGFWFTPGGRIRKNETLDAARVRIAHDEMGLPPSILQRATLMGAWDHLYSDSAFGLDVPVHYVNLPHWLQISDVESSGLQLPEGPEEQHCLWQWLSLEKAEVDTSVHPYVRVYAQWVAARRN